MKHRTEAEGAPGHLGEVILGSLAGLGVPMMLWGVRGSRGSPVTVGAVAGLLGALVGGRLARRPREAPPPREAKAEPEASPEAPPKAAADAPEPRRGPNGRERLWDVEGDEAHAH